MNLLKRRKISLNRLKLDHLYLFYYVSWCTTCIPLSSLPKVNQIVLIRNEFNLTRTIRIPYGLRFWNEISLYKVIKHFKLLQLEWVCDFRSV